jgi:Zn-dependent protease
MQGDATLIAGIVLVVVLSITSHEAAHGFVADRLGDPTARERGRLTFNPIPHISIFFTILLLAFLILSGSHFIFGGAKPVPVDVVATLQTTA